MSFRGRGGRGGGRGGRGGRGGYGSSNFNFNGKHAPHENFPEIPLPDTKFAATAEERALILSTLKLEEFIRNSCYHLEPDVPKKKNEDKEIERFSDRKRKTRNKRESLKSYLKLTPGNFPEELWKDSTRAQPVSKKLRWDKDSDDKTFEVFEKLEAQHKAGENKAEKDGEDEDDEEEEEEEVEEEESSDDDYNQNIEFDDDDDDWNQEEEAQEDYYE